MAIERFEFAKVGLMEYEMFTGNRNSIQNVLECQYKFPQFFYTGDTVHDMYSDRMMQWDFKKYNNSRRRHFGDESQCWFSPDMIKTKLFLEDYLEDEINGFRVVRFTNVSNGNPLWRFDTYKKGPNSPEQETYSGMEGPLLEIDPEGVRSLKMKELMEIIESHKL